MSVRRDIAVPIILQMNVEMLSLYPIVHMYNQYQTNVELCLSYCSHVLYIIV